VPESH